MPFFNRLLQTERLLFRVCEERDLKPFAEMNADPRVMEFFPAVRNYEETIAEYDRILTHYKSYGFSFFTVSEIGGADFIGILGLVHIDPTLPCAPAIEIGWRFAFPFWGKGYATEGASAFLKYGFETLKLPEIVAYTSIQNIRSRRVMEKLGMIHDPKDDFDLPKVVDNRQVLYRKKNSNTSQHV